MNKQQYSSQSAGIPLPSSHIHRTASELQLLEDTVAAEWRDRCMFYRLVTGIRDRHQHQHSLAHQQCCQTTSNDRWHQSHQTLNSLTELTERSIENIIWTRSHDFPPVLNDTIPSFESTDVSSHTHQEMPQSNDYWSLEGYDDSSEPPHMISPDVQYYSATSSHSHQISEGDDQVFDLDM